MNHNTVFALYTTFAASMFFVLSLMFSTTTKQGIFLKITSAIMGLSGLGILAWARLTM